MTTATLDRSFTERVESELPSDKVYVFCKHGVYPLEERNPDGSRNVSRDEVAMMGSKAVVTASHRFRDIVTTIPGAQSAGYEVLDMGNPDDVLFLDRIKLALEQGGTRIRDAGVRIDSGAPFLMPFNNWDTLKPEVVVGMCANMLGDDPDENQRLLTSWAQYELSRKPADGDPHRKPRKDVLDGLDFLAKSAGDESDDTATVEDAS